MSCDNGRKEANTMNTPERNRNYRHRWEFFHIESVASAQKPSLSSSILSFTCQLVILEKTLTKSFVFFLFQHLLSSNSPTWTTLRPKENPRDFEFTDHHSNNTMLDTRDDFNYALYQYTPQLIPAIVATALFIVGGIIHIIWLRRLRASYFTPFVIGCFSKL